MNFLVKMLPYLPINRSLIHILDRLSGVARSVRATCGRLLLLSGFGVKALISFFVKSPEKSFQDMKFRIVLLSSNFNSSSLLHILYARLIRVLIHAVLRDQGVKLERCVY